MKFLILFVIWLRKITKAEEIRLVGVGLSNLKDKDEVLKEEYNLFTYESIIEREANLKKLISKLKAEYGDSFINIGIKDNEKWCDIMKVAIIGGGASGLMCASFLKRNNSKLDITIYEKNKGLGRKILASGNGKCNFMNYKATIFDYNNPDFVKNIFNQYK